MINSVNVVLKIEFQCCLFNTISANKAVCIKTMDCFFDASTRCVDMILLTFSYVWFQHCLFALIWLNCILSSESPINTVAPVANVISAHGSNRTALQKHRCYFCYCYCSHRYTRYSWSAMVVVCEPMLDPAKQMLWHSFLSMGPRCHWLCVAGWIQYYGGAARAAAIHRTTIITASSLAARKKESFNISFWIGPRRPWIAQGSRIVTIMVQVNMAG